MTYKARKSNAKTEYNRVDSFRGKKKSLLKRPRLERRLRMHMLRVQQHGSCSDDRRTILCQKCQLLQCQSLTGARCWSRGGLRRERPSFRTPWWRDVSLQAIDLERMYCRDIAASPAVQNAALPIARKLLSPTRNHTACMNEKFNKIKKEHTLVTWPGKNTWSMAALQKSCSWQVRSNATASLKETEASHFLRLWTAVVFFYKNTAHT